MKQEHMNGNGNGSAKARPIFDCKPVEKIIREEREKGSTQASIATHLNDLGHRTEDGKEWTGPRVCDYALHTMGLPRISDGRPKYISPQRSLFEDVGEANAELEAKRFVQVAKRLSDVKGISAQEIARMIWLRAQVWAAAADKK